jgi:toxin YoeB
MRLVWAPEAWADYEYFCRRDTRLRDKVNALIDDIQRSPYSGIGKPEPLRGNLCGWWSRRITREHRLVYRVHQRALQIAQCRYHY